MNSDIGKLLEDWPYNPDEFTARRIKTRAGAEKIQIRIDMGILQLEPTGRPDGTRPHGCASLLEFYRKRLRGDEQAVLDEDDCEGLFQEAWQYYHRYLSMFYLEDYEAVERDTGHALGIFDLVERHASDDDIKWYFEQYYPHALMMRTRARAMVALQRNDYRAALEHVDAGIRQIQAFVEDWEGDDEEEEPAEISFLREWREELEHERPLSQREQLERDLRVAVESEDFEEAARLRDKIRTMWPAPRRLFRPEH